jgi:4-hydroxymandelate oxidase
MDNNALSGDANQITRAYFDSLLVEMRHIDSVIPSTSMKLYGETFSTPVMMAALSHLKGRHENGMVEMAKAAAALHSVMWAGMGDEAELEQIIATGARTVKIIKPYADNERVLRKIAHAEHNGALAVGMDLDHAFNGNGEYDNVRGFEMAPRTLEDIRGYVNATRLPFIIKGVLSAKEALKCLEAGVRGIVVSHHHGIMPYAVPPLMVLPEIVDVIGGRMPVFVDCGVMTGMDAFKSLALGATAVSAGRAVVGPIAAEGAEGAKNVIARMTKELAGAMARTGSADVRHIDSSLIWRNDGRRVR